MTIACFFTGHHFIERVASDWRTLDAFCSKCGENILRPVYIISSKEKENEVLQ